MHKHLSRWLAVALAALLLVGCDSGGGETGKLTISDLLKQAASNKRAVRSYHDEQQTFYTYDPSGAPVAMAVTETTDVDVVGNRSLAVITTTRNNESTLGYTMVISDQYYQSIDGEVYQPTRYTPEVLASIKQARIEDNIYLDRLAVGLGSPRPGTPAEETINGQPTRHLLADAYGVLSHVVSGTIELWITTDSRPLVVRTTLDLYQADIHISSRSIISRFDVPVAIPNPRLVITLADWLK